MVYVFCITLEMVLLLNVNCYDLNHAGSERWTSFSEEPVILKAVSDNIKSN